MSVPEAILRLVERFERNREAYRSGQYNETQLRREFIDPFFKALGWDVDNERGYAEAYKDVIHEDAIKIGGATKAPDYCFCIGGTRKFFIEAKKPSVNVREDTSPAFQLRRYAWSAKLPLSLITDFEEFAVYDCRVKPEKTDKASTARVMYLQYSDYANRWDEIASIFSREAILKGSFDKYAETSKGKRGTAEVDSAFLKEIESWRELLARNLARRNPTLTRRELNFTVQRTIDRIIFLRICEDRGIEEYGRLLALQNGNQVYERLSGLFRRADERYNSGIFHFHPENNRAEVPDELTLTLSIDDKLLKDILRRIYYPDSPYEFSVLPADILGQVYEQFLGKVIRLTPGHQAVVEDKPEVKKAGGVYYTPTYIVDYIVKHTVGKLVEGKTPKQVAKLRILDPACGSGSFLIGAYQYLLDWHRDWYVAEGPEKHPKELFQAAGGDWRLSTAERKRILLNNVYGVDIDPQAVEVTKLSLLLKVLEGENEQTLVKQLVMFHERALPDLGSNIKCGNSLIGPDFYDSQQMSFLDEEEQYLINVFDWRAEFPDVFKREKSGFDAVIGNPPYIRSQSLGAAQRAYYNSNYQTALGTFDIYVLFVERSVELANREFKGGFILPNKFFTTDYGEGLRKFLRHQELLESLVDFEDAQVFAKSGTYTTLLFLSRTSAGCVQYARLGGVFRDGGRPGLSHALDSSTLQFEPLTVTEDGSRWTLAAGRSGSLLIRLQKTYPAFSTLRPHLFQGLKTSADKIYMLKAEETEGPCCNVINALGERFTIERDILQPIVKGGDVRRYFIDLTHSLFIVYPYTVDANCRASLMLPNELQERFPRAWGYLTQHHKILGARDRGSWQERLDWYAYARSQNIGTFLGSKFLVPYMATELRVAPDDTGTLFFVNITTGGYGLRMTEGLHTNRYILGLLNSSLLNYCVRQMTNAFRGGYFAVNKQALERLPFRPIDFTSSTDKARHDQVGVLAERMLDLHGLLGLAKTGHERIAFQRQIRTTDRQIDRLVYELYGLTEDEIAIVDEGARR